MTSTRNQSLADLERRVEEHCADSNSSFDDLGNRIDELRALIISQGRGPSQESNANNQPPPRPDPVVQAEPNTTHNYSTRISKVDFPKFDGKKVKVWFYKCNQFFLLDETPPESRVQLASIHLEGLALQWHLNYMRGRFDIYPL